MRIAIVDDVATERIDLHKRIGSQLARLALHAEILEFASGTDFLSNAVKKQFDLAFLDIYMDHKNGIDTARELRRFDTNCLLIFTTTSTDHALDAFHVRALQYLVKPYSDEELVILFDEIAKRIPLSDKYVDVHTVGGMVRLRFSDILYAEHFRHQIYIYTADNQRTIIRQTFREFTKKLSDDCFFLCRRGVIINLEYAEDFDGTDFTLKNGKKIPVSRNLSKSARLSFCDFLFKRGPMS